MERERHASDTVKGRPGYRDARVRQNTGPYIEIAQVNFLKPEKFPETTQ
jgi:hypothetical protein